MSDTPTDPWGHTAEEYGEVFYSLDDYFAGKPGQLLSGQLSKRAKESTINHCMMYGDPDGLMDLLVFATALAQGVLVWASLEGYVELTDKAMKSAEPELVEAEG